MSKYGRKKSRTSKKPFEGCYNRSYYDKRGRLHSCYVTNSSFGTKSGWNGAVIFALIFLTCHMLIMVPGMMRSFIEFGSKIDGDASRILIDDKADLLTEAEEEEVMELFYQVYDKSGMPVALYTDDFSWKNHYDYLVNYSEALYYQTSFDEDAMVILVVADESDGFFDWECDLYRGRDTTQCLSADSLDTLRINFRKAMARQNVAEALEYAWNSVMNDLAETVVNWIGIPAGALLIAFYGVFYVAILGDIGKKSAAYRYFKENPQQLSMEPMTLYSVCPNCGASNVTQSTTCAYCGSLLKVRDGNVHFVRPEDI